MSRPDLIVIDTLGALLAHGHGLFGWCEDCAETYDKTLLPVIQRPAIFEIDLTALIAERGAMSWATRIAPVPCSRCGSKRTTVRITSPSKGSG